MFKIHFINPLIKITQNTYQKMGLPVNWMEVNGGFDRWVCFQKMVQVEDKKAMFRFGQCVVHKYEINLKQKWKRNLQKLYLQQRNFFFLGWLWFSIWNWKQAACGCCTFCIVQMTCELISSDVEQCIISSPCSFYALYKF